MDVPLDRTTPFVEGAQFLTVSAIALIVGPVVVAVVQHCELGHGHNDVVRRDALRHVVNFFMNKYWTFGIVT